jgi:hypothetical protein
MCSQVEFIRRYYEFVLARCTIMDRDKNCSVIGDSRVLNSPASHRRFYTRQTPDEYHMYRGHEEQCIANMKTLLQRFDWPTVIAPSCPHALEITMSTAKPQSNCLLMIG